MTQIFSTTVIGHVPISSGGSADYLKADATWADPLGGLLLAATSYTPTLTNVANLDSSSFAGFRYVRIGSIVIGGGRVNVNPTLTATATELGISPPIASNFAAVANCNGVAFASGIAGQGAAIEADVANDRMAMKWIAGDVTDQPMTVLFMYLIV